MFFLGSRLGIYNVKYNLYVWCVYFFKGSDFLFCYMDFCLKWLCNNINDFNKNLLKINIYIKKLCCNFICIIIIRVLFLVLFLGFI